MASWKGLKMEIERQAGPLDSIARFSHNYGLIITHGQ